MKPPTARPSQPERPQLSVVIPVYNEESVLEALSARLYPVLDGLQCPYEIIFIDDGSHDGSVALLRTQFKARPDVTRVILLRANAGQHAAIMAGFERARGTYVVTMDADLQNPPEEIPTLLAKLDAGHDYVGTIRRQRRDQTWRHIASRLMNRLRECITAIRMTDQGCMLRGYHRNIVAAVLASRESQTFIPALAFLYAGNPVEVTVEHNERAAGQSKYSLWRLIHLNFDLITSFSIVPLQIFSLLGIGISILSLLFVLFLFARRLLIGPEAEGVFTLFAILFFMIGILLCAVGILGEYIGRIYIHVRNRPRYVIGAVLERKDDPADSDL